AVCFQSVICNAVVLSAIAFAWFVVFAKAKYLTATGCTPFNFKYGKRLPRPSLTRALSGIGISDSVSNFYIYPNFTEYMVLSWNEIKDRALRFSKDWENTHNEDADAKPFLVEFFNVFGIDRKRMTSFEQRVKKLDDKDGYIDLLWKGHILIEMKSRGKNLDKAYAQAKDYLHGIKQHELPKYILICDFENFRLHDLEDDSIISFKLTDLVQNVQHFSYLLGYQKKVYKEQDPA